jgi:segregation and condensation protein A
MHAVVLPEIEANQPLVAMVKGEKFTILPEDLYIPPDALQIFLETFAGPLDLLLYLIKKQNIDILDLPIANITRQYMQYVDLMQGFRLELAAEYLVMAAMLAEIKSRLLLPRPAATIAEEADPRAELAKRLQEYERFKQAAENLHQLPCVDREIFLAMVEPPSLEQEKPLPQLLLPELMAALQSVLQRAQLQAHHPILREMFSVRERMTHVLDRIQDGKLAAFNELFGLEEGRLGVVVTFIAILELLRQSLIEIVQSAPFALIHIKAYGVPSSLESVANVNAV